MWGIARSKGDPGAPEGHLRARVEVSINYSGGTGSTMNGATYGSDLAKRVFQVQRVEIDTVSSSATRWREPGVAGFFFVGLPGSRRWTRAVRRTTGGGC